MSLRLYLLLLLYVFLFPVLQAQNDIKLVKQKAASLKEQKSKINFLFSTYNKTEDDEVSTYCFDELKYAVIKSKISSDNDTAFARTLGLLYNEIGYDYNYNGVADSAILFYRKSQDERSKIGDSAAIANNFVNIGFALQSVAKYDEALSYYKKASPIYLSRKKYVELAGNCNNIASLYNIRGNMKACIENLMAALNYYTLAKDSKGMAWIYNSLGYVYAQQDEKKLALNWYNKALDLSVKQNYKEVLALVFNNLGTLEQSNNNVELAISYFLKSLKLRRALKDIRGEIMSLNNIGNAFILSNNYQRSELYLNDCKSKCFKVNSVEGLTRCYINFASLYEKWGRPEKAKIYSDSAYYLSKNTNNTDQRLEAARRAYKIEKTLNNDKKALFYLEETISLQDSLKSKDIQKEIYKKQYEYDLDKQEQAFEFQKREKEIEMQQQRKVTSISIIALILVVLCGIFITRNLIQSKKKNKIISMQKDFIEDKQKEIVDSITYAKRLQLAILPNKNLIAEHFKESFVFYKPKDIVAGDFYWSTVVKSGLNSLNVVQKDATLNNQEPSLNNAEHFYLAVCDCTGHGVPGAMVSIVCSNALNKAVKEFGITDPGAVLDKTRELVLETFAQSGEDIKDGMDISLISIQEPSQKSKETIIKWSGANNPLWYINNNEFHEIKPNKQPIGLTEKPVPFTTHTLELNEGAILYLFTDGFADQFGGPKAKKFKYKQLSDLLFEIKDKSLNEQSEILNKKLSDWKGSLEQIDDITIIGLKL